MLTLDQDTLFIQSKWSIPPLFVLSCAHVRTPYRLEWKLSQLKFATFSCSQLGRLENCKMLPLLMSFLGKVNCENV